MVLKANDRRTSCPCHDEFRGPRSDYVRQPYPGRYLECYSLRTIYRPSRWYARHGTGVVSDAPAFCLHAPMELGLKHSIDVAGATAPQEQRTVMTFEKTEVRSLRSNRLSEVTLDHTSEKGRGYSRNLEPIIFKP
ncbi:hypothetical protein TNCV_1016131 [Trichonephila clavipes]|uniref:Uncharacterized protein n=1 Tax=Trichonephila clavipes TaxID=2585209 RepID=A0A8X6VY56_TRICX|nr:hypothetical protein TNCV_1016131 [Trichonephila clavipes]